jgi:thiol-disulfide isomerase/thioredoxin
MTLAMAFITFTPIANAMDEHEMVVKAPVTAIMFYAENCGSCRILDPKIKEAVYAINQDKVDIVIFDFSNSKKIEETKALAASKGLESILQKYGAKTGFAVLVNSNGDILETLKASHETPEIAAKMASAIAQSS